MPTGWTPSIVPSGHDQNYYIVVSDYGKLGIAFAETDIAEADLETTINDLMSGQHKNPVRVVAFNTAERRSEDASEDIAREIMRRLGVAGQELPLSIEAFVDRHLGSDRQLTLRLACAYSEHPVQVCVCFREKISERVMDAFNFDVEIALHIAMSYLERTGQIDGSDFPPSHLLRSEAQSTAGMAIAIAWKAGVRHRIQLADIAIKAVQHKNEKPTFKYQGHG